MMSDLSGLSAEELAERIKRNPSLAWEGKGWHHNRDIFLAQIDELAARAARLAEAEKEQHRLADVAHKHYHQALRLIEEREDQSPPSEHDQLVWMVERVAELEAALAEAEKDREEANRLLATWRAEDRARAEAAERELARTKTALEQAHTMIDRLVDAGVERWHTVVNDEPSLSSWLELSDAEYAAWVEGSAAALLARSEEAK